MGSGPSTLGPGQFTKEQLAQLRAKFFRASRGRRAASIDDLRALPELAGNPLVPRIFSVLDIDGDGKLDLEEFIRAAELFATVRSPDDVYKLAFRVFDADQDGSISAEELYSVLQSILGASFTEQQLERVVQATMAQYDADGDGSLTLAEFCKLINLNDLAGKFTFTL